ncbi:hypothetical protein EDB89DRAFT_2076956 [Lactarius sanguifluus]|nr:hypothetical protein EDB89DRAFT_2076956 [Lactarius sanguifluus]
MCPTLSCAFFDDFLATPVRARVTYLALPNFVGVPFPPRLASPCSTAAPASRLHPLLAVRVTLRIASTLYDKPSPRIAVWPTWQRGEGSRTRTSDEVTLQALCRQVGSLFSNVLALRIRRPWATLTTEVAKAEEGPLSLAL